MTVRPSRVLLAWGKAAAQQGSSQGIGRFFSRTRAVMSLEPMYSPHKMFQDTSTEYWNNSVFTNYLMAAYVIGIIFIVAPMLNTMSYYIERTYEPYRIPLPGRLNVYSDIDDPDWRLKLEMTNKEKREGPKPHGYNRYLDVMKGVRVSDPVYKLYIPSEHGEGVGPNASEIIAHERLQRSH
eukprot:TRINITY_DN5245_c0_g2_i1.p2 TRINITY_DN5245_c0_g2~~TRINITY_DN5245_c0_g2_i1.p2  ORF type:complete len:193 (+),score=51.21 TRINITY_DN5245_c0_g2_i1:38-580(+)